MTTKEVPFYKPKTPSTAALFRFGSYLDICARILSPNDIKPAMSSIDHDPIHVRILLEQLLDQ